MKFNTGSFQIHKNTTKSALRDTLHLIPGEMDAALCEIRFCRNFFIVYQKNSKIIPSNKYVTSDEALRSKDFCPRCIAKLISIIKNDRIASFTRYLQSPNKPKNIPENKSAWTETTCPGCGKPVGFWNRHRKQEHFCTVCKKLVKLPKEAVA